MEIKQKNVARFHMTFKVYFLLKNTIKLYFTSIGFYLKFWIKQSAVKCVYRSNQTKKGIKQFKFVIFLCLLNLTTNKMREGVFRWLYNLGEFLMDFDWLFHLVKCPNVLTEGVILCIIILMYINLSAIVLSLQIPD